MEIKAPAKSHPVSKKVAMREVTVPSHYVRCRQISTLPEHYVKNKVCPKGAWCCGSG